MMQCRLELDEEGNTVFNDQHNTFCVWSYCVRHTIKDNPVSEMDAFAVAVVERWLER